MTEIVICDDDRGDLEYIVNLLQEILSCCNWDYHIRSFISATELLKTVKKLHIAILDISMGAMNGIELGEKVKARCPGAEIIYTTSYEQYCMQAINKVHAYSFLRKPVEKGELKKQVLGLLEDGSKLNEGEEKVFEKIQDSQGKEYPSLKLKLEDIVYFEYIKTTRRAAIIMEKETYEYPCVMEKLAVELENQGFVVNCRGNLINLRHVVKIKGYEIYMDNGGILPLSQRRVADFKEKLNNFLNNNI